MYKITYPRPIIRGKISVAVTPTTGVTQWLNEDQVGQKNYEKVLKSVLKTNFGLDQIIQSVKNLIGNVY